MIYELVKLISQIRNFFSTKIPKILNRFSFNPQAPIFLSLFLKFRMLDATTPRKNANTLSFKRIVDVCSEHIHFILGIFLITMATLTIVVNYTIGNAYYFTRDRQYGEFIPIMLSLSK